MAPAAGSTSFGVHALGLEIGDVLVNGLKAVVVQRPPPMPSASSTSAFQELKHLATTAYMDALMAAQHELEPDLMIGLPDGWREAMAKGGCISFWSCMVAVQNVCHSQTC